MNRSVIGALTVTLFMAVGWSAGTYHGEVTRRVTYTAPTTHVVAPVPDGHLTTLPIPLLPEPLLTEPKAKHRRDLYGNELFDAVATYKRDQGGSVYEEHSPETEVPRLKPPTT